MRLPLTGPLPNSIMAAKNLYSPTPPPEKTHSPRGHSRKVCKYSSVLKNSAGSSSSDTGCHTPASRRFDRQQLSAAAASRKAVFTRSPDTSTTCMSRACTLGPARCKTKSPRRHSFFRLILILSGWRVAHTNPIGASLHYYEI